MTSRSLLPDCFLTSGTIIVIPIEQSEPIPRWFERVAFSINAVDDEIEDNIKAVIVSRKIINKHFFHVTYQGKN